MPTPLGVSGFDVIRLLEVSSYPELIQAGGYLLIFRLIDDATVKQPHSLPPDEVAATQVKIRYEKDLTAEALLPAKSALPSSVIAINEIPVPKFQDFN